MKINKIRLFVLAICTFISAFTLSSAQAATAYPLKYQRPNASPPLLPQMPRAVWFQRCPLVLL